MCNENEKVQDTPDTPDTEVTECENCAVLEEAATEISTILVVSWIVMPIVFAVAAFFLCKCAKKKAGGCK